MYPCRIRGRLAGRIRKVASCKLLPFAALLFFSTAVRWRCRGVVLGVSRCRFGCIEVSFLEQKDVDEALHSGSHSGYAGGVKVSFQKKKLLTHSVTAIPLHDLFLASLASWRFNRLPWRFRPVSSVSPCLRGERLPLRILADASGPPPGTPCRAPGDGPLSANRARALITAAYHPLSAAPDSRQTAVRSG